MVNRDDNDVANVLERHTKPESHFRTKEFFKIYHHISVNFFCTHPPITRKRPMRYASTIGVASHLSTTPRWGILQSAFPTGTSKLARLFYKLSL